MLIVELNFRRHLSGSALRADGLPASAGTGIHRHGR
jgi:hypothetical protein